MSPLILIRRKSEPTHIGCYGDERRFLAKINCSLFPAASIYEWMMADDMELVREFATRQSDAAFETLVLEKIN